MSNFLSSAATPDFSMPRDVASSASEAYRKALATDNPEAAIEAAVQWTIAEESISSDSTAVIYSRLISLSESVPAPYSNVVQLLRATFLNQMYNCNRWNYDKRQLPESPLSPDPKEWSGLQFRNEVFSLCRSALSDEALLSSTPLSVISSVVTPADGGSLAGYSLLDFMAVNAVRLLGPEHKDFSRRIIDSLVAADEKRLSAGEDCREALLSARVMQLSMQKPDGASASQTADAILADYRGTDLYYLAIAAVYDNLYGRMKMPERQKFLAQVKEARDEEKSKSSAGSKPVSYLDNLIKRIEASNVEFKLPSQILPGRNFEVAWTSTSCPGFNVMIVRIPESVALDYVRYDRVLNLQKVKACGEVVEVKSVACEGPLPFVTSGKCEFSPLRGGTYVACLSTGRQLSTIKGDRTDFVIFNVSGLSSFRTSGGGERKVYVTDAFNGTPVAGAELRISESSYSHGKRVMTNTRRATTDSRGCASIPLDKSLFIEIKRGTDRLYMTTYREGDNHYDIDTSLEARLLTDLAIYHPGDTLRGVAVLVRNDHNILAPASGGSMTVTLYNPNGEKVDSLSGMADSSGRLAYTFGLPTAGITGMYRVEASDGNHRYYGAAYINVAEYKAPTFMVRLERPDLRQGDADIDIKGNVATYSGVPVANAEVLVSITFRRWWRMFDGDSDRSFNLKGVTDGEGNFTVTIAAEELKGLDRAAGVFSAVASATSEAGETCDSEPVRFSLGDLYRIEANIPGRILAGDSESNIIFPVKVCDALGNPVVRQIDYTVEGVFGSDVRLSGTFTTPRLELPASSLPSGQYRLTFTMPQGGDKSIPSDTVTVKTVIWRHSDKTAPVASAVWTPLQTIYAEQGAAKVKVPVGNAYKGSAIFMMESKSVSEVGKSRGSRTRWIYPDGAMTEVEVDAPAEGERLRIIFRGVHDLESRIAEVQVLPASEQRKMEIIPTTFRDKLTPGAREKWNFRITVDSVPVAYPAVMAVMSNQALDAIAPFEWSFDLSGMCNYLFTGSVTNSDVYDSRESVSWSDRFKYISVRQPEVAGWNFYGRELYGEYVTGMVLMNRTYKSASKVMRSESVVDEAADYDGALPESAALGTVELTEMKVRGTGANMAETEYVAPQPGDDIPMREMECPLAFFMPDLTGDDAGNVELEFETPNFNTTWKLQLAGYDPRDMKSATTKLTAVASKPVMVQTNAPRFLRTGDRTVINAMIFNNSDDALAITPVIEVFDPVSGRIYTSSSFTADVIAPSASRTVSLEFVVPQFITSVGIRTFARSDKGNDGEQTAIAVLPATQPVLDATTYYLSSAETHFRTKLPSMSKSDKVTLEYCDNPEWYVLMELNGLLDPDGDSSLSLADALYSNAVGSGILRRNQTLAAALASVEASGDTLAMTSALQRNGDLKMMAEGETPWVNNAASETKRMRSVSTLADRTRTEATVKDLVARLGRLQQSDGGWTWCKDMPSSMFITEEVLARFATMIGSGDLPEGAGKMIGKGVGYCDATLEEDYRREKSEGRDYEPTMSDVNYLLLRSRFDKRESSIIKDIRLKTIEMVKREWKRSDVAAKCLGAMLLHRYGEKREAVKIMESVRQFGSYTPQKGMWFDGASGALSRTSPVESAALGLMAFREILPGDESIERIRQYLLLSRQTQDWQLGMSSAKSVVVVQAVLSGERAESRTPYSTAQILIDGKPVDLGSNTIGSVTVDLDPAEVSGKTLEIRRESGAPAWGGVLRQYEARIKDVKPRHMEQLKIKREYYPVVKDSLSSRVAGATDRFRKGDRIRVTMTITTDRDLDYVAVKDLRGACMEPREQLTRYVAEDGLIYVMEPRNESTNLYFYRIPKGVHIVCYEVTADRDGSYSCGSATAQSLYYPLITARTGAALVTVE